MPVPKKLKLEAKKRQVGSIADVSISMKDLVEGRAYIEIPTWGKLKILERAGAPWADKHPDAKLSDIQTEALAARDQTKVWSGATSTGKSTQGAVDLLLMSLVPGTMSVLYSETYDQSEPEFKFLIQAYQNLFGKLSGCFTSYKKFSSSVGKDPPGFDTVWDSTVRLVPARASKGQRLMGREYDLVVCGEASHLNASIFRTKALRALVRRHERRENWLRRTGILSLYTTPDEFSGPAADVWEQTMEATEEQPEHRRWYAKDQFGHCLSWFLSVWLRRVAIWEKPTANLESVRAAKARLTREEYEEQYLGKMIFRAGLVYKEFKPRHITIPATNRDEYLMWLKTLKFCVGMDTARHFSAILVGLDREGVYWVIDEMYSEGQTIMDDADATKGMVVANLGDIAISNTWDACKKVVSVFAVDRSTQDGENLEHLLETFITRASKEHIDENKITKSYVIPRVESANLLRSLFKLDRLRIIETRAPALVKQLRHIKWKERDIPKGADHSVDALRYGIWELRKLGPKAEEEIKKVITPQSARENAIRDWDYARKQKIRRRRRGFRFGG